jgi:hypothetical protein
MSTTVTALSDSLPNDVPKLDPTGVNWAIFEIRFTAAIRAKRQWGHFDGSSTPPVPVSVTSPGGTVSITPEDAADVEKWNRDEATAKNLLLQKVPDSIAMKIRRFADVAGAWKAIATEFTEKGAFAQTELHTSFLESKCGDKADVRVFLDSLRSKREELASVGVDISEKEYRSTIISSLPGFLANFASAQLTAAKLWSPTKIIEPDTLISIICEEYDRQKTQRSRRSHPSHAPHPKHKADDEAIVAESSRTDRSGKSSAKRVCWTCGKEGHMRNKCPKKSASSVGSSKPRTKGTANAVVDTNPDSDFEEGGANGVEEDIDGDDESIPGLQTCSDSSDTSSNDGSMPGLQTASDSTSDDDSSSEDSDLEGELGDDGADMFSEVGDDDAGDIEGSEVDWSEVNSFTGRLSGSEGTWDHVPDPLEEAANVTDNHVPPTARSELYDSGCSKHISPYRDDFESFRNIPPKTFRAANKQQFSATGKGEMNIDIPNGTGSGKLQLTEVLYSPEVGYTLISIGKLDDLGFETTFANGKCTIRSPDGETVGTVPKTAGGLYRTEHEPGSANAAEILTLDQFHRRMGHIAPETARRLVQKGFVTGVKLDTSSGDDVFCESCVYAKATRKPVSKLRQGERAAEFGGEIHSDLWGPAPVETLNGRRYFVSFIDDNTRLSYLYFLRKKKEAFAAYKDFEAEAKTQYKAPIKILHSDRGGEYLGKGFELHLRSAGTKQKLTIHDTPQHNGVAERFNRTIAEMVRAFLHASGLPKSLWGEAARHGVWI